MKKTVVVFLVVVVLVAVFGVAFVACNTVGDNIGLYCNDLLYSHGEQTINITITNNTHTFNESIAVSDVTVGDGLEGKEVIAVAYVDETTISVTLSGTVTLPADETTLGIITVSGGISDNAIGTAYAYVYTPKMTTTGVSSQKIGSVYSCSTTFVLPYGSFVEEYITTDYITLLSDSGSLSVELTDAGNLKIKVIGYESTSGHIYPEVKIAAEVTTFNKELTVYIGYSVFQDTGYSLV